MLHESPEQSAIWMIDDHVRIKMLVESIQMMTNCYPLEILETAPKTVKGNIRKYSHWNHPDSIWVRESYSNFLWLLKHAIKLYEESVYRFNSSFKVPMLEWIDKSHPNMAEKGLTNKPLSMPDIYKSNSIVESYRNFYREAKKFNKKGKYMHVWTKRETPYWI